MEKFIIDNKEDAQEFFDWLEAEKPEKTIKDDCVIIGNESFQLVGEANVLFSKAFAEEFAKSEEVETIIELPNGSEIHFEEPEEKLQGYNLTTYSEQAIFVDEPEEGLSEETLKIVTESVIAPTSGEVVQISSPTNPYDNSLIYGKNNTEGIVSVEVKDDLVYLFKNDGTVETVPHTYWVLTSRPTRSGVKLDGNLHYKYINTFDEEETFKKARGVLFGKKTDMYNVYDNVEAAMMMEGFTLFKGLKVNDVSVLSYDIEANGLINDETAIPYAGLDAKVYMITITFRNTKGKIERFMFSVDDYEDDDVTMIEAFCKKVQELDPSIIVGHNLFGYDFPYLSYCYGTRNGTDRELELGRDCSEIKYNTKFSKFRKDGSQEYPYRNIKIFGRQIIDTFFLSIKYDFSRKYPSNGLKAIIEYEGLIKKDRQFYDASQIAKNWHILEEREKIKAYGKDDADDALALFDLMIPQFFYYTQSIPMSFQTINNTATGRQINSFLVRAYLQDGHSIPKATDKRDYGGGISFGVAGVHQHVFKIDIKSMYPSIMLQYNVYDKEKDPKRYFLEMVEFFFNVRDEYKKQLKETGDIKFSAMEQSTKVFVNSAYGTLGTPGLNFNSCELADFVTRTGRDIIAKTIKWATSKDIDYWKDKSGK